MNILITLLLIFTGISSAHSLSDTAELQWEVKSSDQVYSLHPDAGYPTFDQAVHFENQLPYFSKVYNISDQNKNEIAVAIQPLKTKKLAEPSYRNFKKKLNSSININKQIINNNGVLKLRVRFVPATQKANQIKLLESFSVNIKSREKRSSLKKQASSTPLATGNWYQFSISKSGVHKITYDQVSETGIDASSVKPSNLHVFGHGGHRYPLRNGEKIPKGLPQNHIVVRGGNDGSFDEGDYILFYAQGPQKWKFQNKHYEPVKNPYANSVYYYLVNDPSKSFKGVSTVEANGVVGYSTRSYDQLLYHEKGYANDVTERIKTGRDWYGEEFNEKLSQTIPFKLENPVDSFYFKVKVAHRSRSKSNFRVGINDQRNFNINLPNVRVSDYNAQYTIEGSKASFVNLSAEELKFNLRYKQNYGQATGWLNYIYLNGRSPLNFNDQQLLVQDKYSRQQAIENAGRFYVNTEANQFNVWRITDKQRPVNLPVKTNNDEHYFQSNTDTLHRFVVFKDEQAYKAEFKGKLANQNLHGLAPTEMLIITPGFLEGQAKELANFHRNEDQLKVHTVTPQSIYNEFSSGVQDIAAIRNFVRYMHQKGQQNDVKLKYLLLFGDASYDYKDRLDNNTNYVPTYQSESINHPISSFASDDFYGFLDEGEGNLDQLSNNNNANHDLEIGIGRMPFNKKQQAKEVIQKIKHYYNQKTLGSWRNTVSLVADDEDNNKYFRDSENLTDIMTNNYPSFNVEKIYLDAYQQKSTPNGARYPDAKRAINRRIEEGNLVMNYMGHGGELGLAHERVLQLEDVKEWENYDKLPLIMTATCEFSRFDDPQRTSLGEKIFFKPDGGAIGLLSTTRLVFASSNFRLTKDFLKDNLFEKENGDHKTLGEILKDGKNQYNQRNEDAGNALKFALIGDPALTLAYPQENIQTTKVTDHNERQKDTLGALGKYTVHGEVVNDNGQLLKDFNGIVHPTIFDKPVELTTLGNDEGSSRKKFKSLENVIFKGRASVENGNFKFTFVTPKDISYQKDFGKISYYADNGKIDANGASDVVIGGTAEDPIQDDEPPVVDVYMNDTTFNFGGTTGEEPLLVAKVYDENGLNIVSGSIGHEPSLLIDDGAPILLNDAYEAGLDNYKKGTIKYQLKDLPEGRHRAKVKVWDVVNNSGTGFTEFIVANSNKLVIDKLLNYPNPFQDQTKFKFEHNGEAQSLNAKIEIVKPNGTHVRTLNQSVSSEKNEITWSGRNSNHNKLKGGVYIYRLTLTTDGGKIARKSNKLVILK